MPKAQSSGRRLIEKMSTNCNGASLIFMVSKEENWKETGKRCAELQALRQYFSFINSNRGAGDGNAVISTSPQSPHLGTNTYSEESPINISNELCDY